MKEKDPRDVLAARIRRAGSRKALAKELNYNYVLLCEVARGGRPFSSALLAKLGLRRIVVDEARS